MSIETKLKVEIEDELDKLSDLEIGSDKYKATVDGLGKLLDRTIELEKIENEQNDRVRARKEELDLKRQQMIEEKKDRLVKNCIACAGIAVPTLVTIWGTIKSIKFEETGTITTIMGRGFINKLLPKK